ncbi:MAG: septum formation initiator family protein [bacterium]|nr:septum formation initiator family protein [bacterium]
MGNRRAVKIIFLALLLGYIAFIFGQACYRNVVQTVRLREKAQQVALEERRNENLKKRINELSTDEGIEKEARQKLGMTAPGEVGYRVLTKEKETEATATATAEKEAVTQDSGSGKEKTEDKSQKP